MSSNYPPGVSERDINEHFGSTRYCDECERVYDIDDEGTDTLCGRCELEHGENNMKCKIEISMNNDAFIGRPGSELARILREIADKAEEYDGAEDFREFTHVLHDANGNKVGGIEVSGIGL